MRRRTRAVLIGIDAYASPVPPLRGCVADIRAFEALLRARAAAAGEEVDVVILRDGEATRDAVIAAVREHLGAATEGETALLYYSGHGSQEPAPPEHAALEPDGLNETLVLHDSRTGPGRDLADKELAVLLAEVAATGAHVAVVLDCCHSGSGLRGEEEDGIGVRRAPADTRTRRAEDYLGGVAAATRAADGAPSPADWLPGAAARYVLLAACRSDQTAKEVAVEGQARGAMSASLERTLRATRGPVSYQLLQRAVVAAVRNLAADQTPQLESPVAADVTQPFLGGAASPATPLLTAGHDRERGWVLDAGAVHGIPPVVADAEPAAVALAPLEDGDGPAVAEATVRSVGPAASVLDVPDGAALDEDATYRARLVRLPVAPLSVRVAPDAGAVREALERSPVVRPVDGPAELDVRVAGGRLRLTRHAADRPLVQDQPLDDAAAMARMVEHVARWELLARRTNPATRLEPEAIDLAVLDADGGELPDVDGTVTCAFGPARGGAEVEQPAIRVRVRNGSGRRLFYALLALSELYGVTSLLAGGGQWLDAGEEVHALDDEGRPLLHLDVPEGLERTSDVLKLLVSTEELDAQALQQADLAPPTRLRGMEGGERGISTRPRVPSGGDWATAQVVLTTVRPGAVVRVGAGAGDPVPLAPGVVVEPHPALQAGARLTTSAAGSRDASVALVPPLLLDAPALTLPFGFTGVRAVGEELSVLELQGVEHAGQVTPDQPLVLRLDGGLARGEHVLPIAFDGEDHLPAGFARAGADSTRIELTRLPADPAAAERSLGGAVKVLFRKVALQHLGGEYDFPRLSVVDLGDAAAPRFDAGEDAVRAAVRDARRVLLLVHGIIGDTRAMAAAVAASPGLVDAYDAVLAFDYESIGTGLPETAQGLRARLRAAGVHEGGGRHVDVLAHSMGGLVVRWLVELEGGAELVDRVVMCGTPNAGSPWPRVQDLATAGLGLALNRLAGLTGPFAVATQALGFLVASVEKVDVTLDAMRPGSELLQALAQSGQPPVPYVAVAGDVPFGPGGDASRGRRILRKLVPERVIGSLFGGGPHDLAVSVRSATTFGGSWTRQPESVDADCNHLTYLASGLGLAAVEGVLLGTADPGRSRGGRAGAPA